MELDGIAIAMLIGVFLVMAGFASSIDLSSFLMYIKKPKQIVIGLLCQFIILPLTAFVLIKILSLPSLEAIGLIVTASCPGGTLSNFWCWYFGTDLALSIAMTSCSSLLSFIFLTFNCVIYIPLVTHNKAMIDYISLTLSVAVLLFGVIVGLLIIYKQYNKLKKPLHISGGIAVAILVLLGMYQNMLISDKKIWQLSSDVFISTFILNVIAWFTSFSFSYFIFKLRNNQCIAVSIECCNQNVILAISIVLLTVTDKKDANIAVGIPMLYGALNTLFILLFGTLFRIFGFVKNENDGNYERSGFTKCAQCCTKPKYDTCTPIQIDLNNTNMNDCESTPLSENEEEETKAKFKQFCKLDENDNDETI